jgi:hypothetical protein
LGGADGLSIAAGDLRGVISQQIGQHARLLSNQLYFCTRWPTPLFFRRD